MSKDLVEGLILKFLSRTISEDEVEQLNTLIERPENEKLFKDFIKIKYSLDRNFGNKDLESAKKLLLDKVHNGGPRKGAVRKLHLYRYAVAASIAILIAVSIFVFERSSDKFESSPAQVLTQPILPGSDKAVLTLGNGEVIALKRGKSFTGKHIKSDGESLFYSPDQETDDKIEHNYLTIPRGGQFYLQLSDGTKVWLNSESMLKYPVKFPKDQDRVVELIYGEAYFDVSHSTNHSGASFKVLNEGQEVEVLGTEFNIRAFKDKDRIYTTLVQGKVALHHNGQTVTLEPGQQAVLREGESVFTTDQVDVAYVVAWKNGYFDFMDMSLGEMMEELSRWYDFEPHYENPDKRNMTFSGRLNRYEELNELLKLIEATGTVSFENIKDGTLTIK